MKLTESVVLASARVDSLQHVKNLNLWGRQLTDVCSWLERFHLTEPIFVVDFNIIKTTQSRSTIIEFKSNW